MTEADRLRIPTAVLLLRDVPDGAYLRRVGNTLIGGVGSAGGDGSANTTYTHVQSSPAAVWTITHSLGRHPSVTVVDSGGTHVVGGVKYLSANQLTVTFSAAFSGRAYLN